MNPAYSGECMQVCVSSLFAGKQYGGAEAALTSANCQGWLPRPQQTGLQTASQGLL